jgi:hypothetical protein
VCDVIEGVGQQGGKIVMPRMNSNFSLEHMTGPRRVRCSKVVAPTDLKCQLDPQSVDSRLVVFILAATFVTFGRHPCGNMEDPDGGLHFVSVLSPGASTT